jgi:glycosyltransferase involved in cell wall biosynthesis
VRIGIDATPLLGEQTGVGTYTSRLLSQLQAGWTDDFVATAFTWRGRSSLSDVVPAGVEVTARPAPARLLRAVWGRDWRLPVELLSGPLDVFHATNFVLPPTRHAAAVLTVHDLAFLRHPETVSAASQAYRHLVPLGVARADVILTPSAAVADQLSDAYAGAGDRILVTPLGVEPAWFDAVPADREWLRQLGITGPYVVAVGTREPRKNLAALVAAYRELLRQSDDVPDLVFAGGRGWGDLLSTADVPPDRLHMTGYLPLPDLRRLVAGASLLAFPSRDEGFGLPPLEALACGIPVVANDIPVLREVLGTEAVWCDADDASAFAQALRDAVSDPSGTAASRRAHAARFTWRRCAEVTYEGYRQAVAARR